MSYEPTIPCPVCKAPIHVRQVQLPSGNIARIFAEPLTISDNYIDFHEHQSGDSKVSTTH
ncbi:MAG: hypothetical protein RLT87_07805 [Gammaproteobacteria bacterium]